MLQIEGEQFKCQFLQHDILFFMKIMHTVTDFNLKIFIFCEIFSNL